MNYLVIDLEMCNVPRDYRSRSYKYANETIQIGAVLLDEEFKRIGTLSQYVHPEHGVIDPFIQNLTGIRNSQVKKAPRIEEALLHMIDWIGDREYKVYAWSGSDRAQLLHEIKAKKICDELGYDLQIVRLDWDSLIPAVSTGQVDCVIAGQSITEERLQAVDFTEPYYYATIVTLVKQDGKYADAKSVADLAGATCTSQQSTIWYDTCLPQIQDANILAATASAPDMLMSLNADKCDLVVTDQPTGKGALVAYPDFKLLEFGGGEDDFQVTDEDINIGISLKKGNTELKEAIDSVLSKMTKDDFSAMMDEAISVQPLAN